ncbi:hypothetical protein EKO27_g7717 [Xylaria grammica]|uniref:Uncharacterized protein n=1 Tax=Xylaria grammica TaxID=363999 RepID=A0A439CZ31_9PEZI|nr:hypothetical protein EKO27_g7717 [Xylaria grammica]
MEPTLDIVYINGGPQGFHEGQVASQGWRWMRTNTIDPTQSGSHHAIMSSGRPDRLPAHFHHGPSTHMVISGDLRIRKQGAHTGSYEISDAPGARRQDHVPPRMKYGATSRTGCTFVEGHQCLSPKSAERFIDRETLRVVSRPDARWRSPSESDLKLWLRTLKFNPEGRAHPDVSRGEEPILDASQVSPPIPLDFLNALSEWFEEEWEHYQPPLRPPTKQETQQQKIVLLLAFISVAIALFAFKYWM